MPLRQAQGRLSRQPPGPFDLAQGRLPTLHEVLIEIEVADGLAGVGSLFGLANGFLKFLFQQVGGVFLSFEGLAKDGVAATVLLFHGPRGFLHIRKGLGLYRGGVRDHGLRRGIDLEDSVAARTGHFKRVGTLGHLNPNDTPKSANGRCG